MEFATIIVTRAEKTKHDVGIIKQAVFLSQKAAKKPKNVENYFRKQLYIRYIQTLFSIFFFAGLYIMLQGAHRNYFVKIGCSAKNVRISGYQNHPQTKFSLHISICKGQLKHKCLLLDTLQQVNHGRLYTWTENSFPFFLYLKPVEISKKCFNII